MGDGEGHRPQPGGIARRAAPVVLAHEPPFTIDGAEFRPATREVRFGGQVAVIEPRVMQFLIALHRAGGAVVAKDDLLQSCWDGRIVGDDAINRIVSRLRGVADREAGGQFRIETITKVGYRLLSATGETLDPDAAPLAAPPSAIAPQARSRHPFAIAAAAALLLLAVGAGLWAWWRPAPAAAGMTVRLAAYRPLSPDLPATMSGSIEAEIVAAFNTDGIVGVTAAPAPAGGAAPGYLLDGTIYRIGDAIRVISRLTNARSGAVLWSDSVDYTADQAARVPHKVAADVGTVVRCGLSGAATHRAPLSDAVLGNYMRYCQEYWAYGGSRTLRYAQLVVAAVPDFSWGWSAVGNGYMQAANAESDGQRAAALRAAGRRAEDRAIALDPRNSEALGHMAHLIDRRDWLAQETLFRRAIAAKPLDCGCEHSGYGQALTRVGRLRAAIDQIRAATDQLALWPDSQIAMGDMMLATGQVDQAAPWFAAAIDLSRDSAMALEIAATRGTENGDHAAALAALRDPRYPLPAETRAVLIAGYQALATADPAVRAAAIRRLVALPPALRREPLAPLLATLGATEAALGVAAERPSLLWRRSMRGVTREPGFAAVVDRLGLIAYWRRSGTRPDACLTSDPPPFCRLL